MLNRFFGIKFPFQNSTQGFYFDLTKTTKESVKSNLLHLLLTKKGARLYKPDFGCDLYQYIFDPMDNQTFDLIKNEIVTAIQSNIQGINIDNIEMTTDSHALNLQINYSYNDGIFLVKDLLNIKI
jgi:uncharacterized protein